MATFKRLTVLSTMMDVGLIPLFYEKDIDTASRIVEACVEGGARCIEFTNRGDQAHLVFEKLVQRFAGNDRLILGAGSIIDAGTASLYIQLGANFIVGPMLNDEVAYTCNQRKIPYLPGCGSVNEISHAERLGVEICKVFPGSQVGGPGFVKAVLGPMPWTSLMPTGGVSFKEESIREWFQAGAVCVGMGSKLITREDVANGNFSEITAKVKQVLAWIQAVKGER